MNHLTITVQSDTGVKVQGSAEDEVILVYDQRYQAGDKIIFSTTGTIPGYYFLRVDDCVDESFVYLSQSDIEFVVPFDEKHSCYNPKAFVGDRHYLSMRLAKPYEISAYRNLALNPMDQPVDVGSYPHAYANVETRGEAQFFARNAIDGVLSNESHGSWPYHSWGINQQEDAEITIDFGRKVNFDQIVIYLRADFPHDNWWTQAKLTFSDGTSEVIKLGKSDRSFSFRINKNNVSWVKMSDMLKADDPSPFPALKQIQVFGTECL